MNDSVYERFELVLQAHACGDALGAPYENREKEGEFDPRAGRMVHRLGWYNRFTKETKRGVVGQYTDDFEMTSELLRALATTRFESYPRTLVDAHYRTWVNSTSQLGHNTRRVYKGVRTQRGVDRRRETNAQALSECQSNGPLMRCAPLALLPLDKWRDAVHADVSLTNPNAETIECVEFYVMLMHAMLRGGGKQRSEMLYLAATLPPERQGAHGFCTPEFARVLSDVRRGVLPSADPRFYTKGRVHTALNYALTAVLRPRESIDETLCWVVSQGGDTDTNAAIAGALFAAAFPERSRASVYVDQVRSFDPSLGDYPRDMERYGYDRVIEVLRRLRANNTRTASEAGI